MQKNYKFTPSDAAVVLVDHQPGVVAMVKSVPAPVLSANAGLLARLAEEMGIPLVVTSTRENLEFLGTTITDIQKAAPKAYANRVKRAGTLNAFHDPAFVAALKSTGRKNLVIAGVLTDVCLYHSVVSAIEAGYFVTVVADASGTSSELADRVTYDELRDLGAVVTSTYGVLFQLYNDLGSTEGKRAEAIAAGSVPVAA